MARSKRFVPPADEWEYPCYRVIRGFFPGVFETRFRILYRQHYRNIILKNVTTIFRTLKTEKQLRRFWRLGYKRREVSRSNFVQHNY